MLVHLLHLLVPLLALLVQLLMHLLRLLVQLLGQTLWPAAALAPASAMPRPSTAPLSSRLAACLTSFASSLAALALGCPAEGLAVAAELAPEGFLLALEAVPLGEQGAEFLAVGSGAGSLLLWGWCLLRCCDGLLGFFDCLLGHCVFRVREPVLEIAAGDGDLAVFEVVIVRKGTDRAAGGGATR